MPNGIAEKAEATITATTLLEGAAQAVLNHIDSNPGLDARKAVDTVVKLYGLLRKNATEAGKTITEDDTHVSLVMFAPTAVNFIEGASAAPALRKADLAGPAQVSTPAPAAPKAAAPTAQESDADDNSAEEDEGVDENEAFTMEALQGLRYSTPKTKQKPFVPPEESIQPGYIICLEDGARKTMLKRYLKRKFNMTPEQYKAKWGLPAEYPMNSPLYMQVKLGKLSREEADRIAATQAGPQKPAVPIEESVQDDYLVCLEDGKKMRMLKRYLARAYRMTPEQYRQKWGLPDDYPMSAPNFSEKKSAVAKQLGFGVTTGRNKSGAKSTTAAVAQAAPAPAPAPAGKKPAGRKTKQLENA